MSKKLFFGALIKFTVGALLVGALLFVPAGGAYFRGWLLMAVLFIPMFFGGIVMMIKNPGLLQSRLQAKESSKTQDRVVKLSGLMFLTGFTVAGLGVRYGWYVLPRGVSVAAAAVFLIAYGLYGEVLRENTYLSRTVQVQQGQRVIDTGLYAVVRHPMYSVTVLLFLSMPLILGSLYAFLIFLAYPPIIAVRIHHEEAFLAKELPGYDAYRQKVKYRLIPWIW